MMEATNLAQTLRGFPTRCPPKHIAGARCYIYGIHWPLSYRVKDLFGNPFHHSIGVRQKDTLVQNLSAVDRKSRETS